MFKSKKLQRNVNETKKEKWDNENGALNKENKVLLINRNN